ARVVVARRLGERGQCRRLRHVQVARRLPKEHLGGGLDPEDVRPQADLVQVQLEDRVLGEVPFQLDRDAGFLELARIPLLPADLVGEDVARQLHRDRREALGPREGEDVGLERAEHAQVVDAVVRVEALVFDRDERLPQVQRQLGERHDRAALDAELGDEPAVGRVHLGGLLRARPGVDPGDAGAALGRAHPGPRAIAEAPGEQAGEGGAGGDLLAAPWLLPPAAQQRQTEGSGRRGGRGGRGEASWGRRTDRRDHLRYNLVRVRRACQRGAPFVRFAAIASPDLLRELEWRGFVHQATPGLDGHLSRGPVTAYCGFDPTAPSLQIGNLMPLMLLASLQRHGHRPIVLMGGGTGMIGDPAGKPGERPLLSKEQIRENVQRMRDQAARFLEFGAGPTAALLLDNAKWLIEQRVIDFLRDVGKHFTVNVMLQKESVHARLDTGLSYTEFSYMLLQAYDFLHLYRERQCTLQVGGTEQWGNITAGIDLIRRVESAEAHGLVAPLVTMASGQKFGKTEAGAIYLDPTLTSPYKFYQFWINVDDRDVEKYLKLFTHLPADEIKGIAAQQAVNPAKRPAQRALATTVTSLVHGAEVLSGVQAASAILFGEGQAEVHPQVFEILAGEIPT